MTASKFSISFVPDLAHEVSDAADREDTSVSAWLADAAQLKLRIDGARRLLGAWEEEFGPITDDEVEAAAALWPV